MDSNGRGVTGTRNWKKLLSKQDTNVSKSTHAYTSRSTTRKSQSWQCTWTNHLKPRRAGNHIKAKLNKTFKMTDNGEAKFFLGMRITRDRSTGTIKITNTMQKRNKCGRFPTKRPDIPFAVNSVNRFNPNYGRPHWNAVKRIMR